MEVEKKLIPAWCAQAGLGHWEAGVLHSLSPAQISSPCGFLPGLWSGQSPSGMGYKQRTQEGCY